MSPAKCPSCHGTGTFPAPYDMRPGFPAHPYTVACGCGQFARHPGVAALNIFPGSLLGGNTHRLVLASTLGGPAWVDELLAGDIERMWAAGIETHASCQGGPELFHRERYISVPGAQAERAAELLSWPAVIEEPLHDGSVRLVADVRTLPAVR